MAEGQPLPPDIDGDRTAIGNRIRMIAGNAPTSEPINVEQIQDMVEIELMRREHYRVARRYILYRTDHSRLRAVRHVGESLDGLADAHQRLATM